VSIPTTPIRDQKTNMIDLDKVCSTLPMPELMVKLGMGDQARPRAICSFQGALAVGDAAGSVRKEAAARRAGAEVALRCRLQRAKREGDLPPNADPAELARYVMTVLRGMAVQGADGAGRDQLRRVAQVALRAWPNR
jgi:hypothetical protein